ncbi:hypothetical protein Mal15_58810 [Stieleria maiorica]|uniref:Uncharacterized protein n=1 Tax=Stieleria maiorica TaxID=2795974 RepID=A0A5B9MN25_9BACT|nr:hypothetical protein [Stieleria maiorica]QEG01800.1 hypothetical protein Mal15_58810 [Stieleria maiorica]
MNVALQKYGPPTVVIAIALYLGWPPPAPLDLGEDVVRAKSVRWKISDLQSPSLPTVIGKDPFAAVLVEPTSGDPATTAKTPESVPDEPTGPTPADLHVGLRLGGIAQTDHHRWAIINGRVCKIGDQLPVIGFTDLSATVRDIAADHVTVVAGPLTVELKQQERKPRSGKTTNASPPAVTPSSPQTDSQTPDPDEQDPDEDLEDEDSASATSPRPGNDGNPSTPLFQATP